MCVWQDGSVQLSRQVARSAHYEVTLVGLIFFICVGVTAALTILGGWHLYLISFSETTIEFYTNKRDARRMKKEGQVRQRGEESGRNDECLSLLMISRYSGTSIITDVGTIGLCSSLLVMGGVSSDMSYSHQLISHTLMVWTGILALFSIINTIIELFQYSIMVL